MTATKALNPIQVGNPVFIRSVTHHYTGRIVEITPEVLILEDAAWIASDGRFHEALTKGVLDEVEPYSDPVAINRGAILDVTLWRHPLPREVK